MSTLDTTPTSPDVIDRLTELLDELEDAGGEIVITCASHPQSTTWTVQVLTDWRGPGRPCDHAATATARYLADAIDNAVEDLRKDQNHG